MTSNEHESSLPRVEKLDLLTLIFDDVTSPSHEQRWAHFYHHNPALAREVLKRVSVELQFTEGLTDTQKYEMNRAVTGTVSFVVAALDTAAKRKNIEILAIDGVSDGEVPPP